MQLYCDLRVRIEHAYLSRFSSPENKTNGAKESSATGYKNIRRQVYPLMGLLCEPSLDSSYKGLGSLRLKFRVMCEFEHDMTKVYYSFATLPFM